jgi:hypothetical protein
MVNMVLRASEVIFTDLGYYCYLSKQSSGQPAKNSEGHFYEAASVNAQPYTWHGKYLSERGISG